MIGLRIGYGVLIRLGMRLIGPLRIIMQAVLPLPSQSILPQASSAAKAAPIARHAPPQTVSTVIAVSPVLAGTGQVVNEGFFDSSISSNSRSSGKKHSTLLWVKWSLEL